MHGELIESYVSAYTAANGECPYDIRYERGWFIFKPPGSPSFRKRRAEVIEMIAVLRRRSLSAKGGSRDG